MPSTDTMEVAQWIQSGSILAFASAVLWELRQQRNERNQQTKIITALMKDLSSSMAVILDRSGIRRKTPQEVPIVRIPLEDTDDQA